MKDIRWRFSWDTQLEKGRLFDGPSWIFIHPLLLQVIHLIIRCCLEIRIPKNSITSKQWRPGSTELKKEAFVGKFCLLRGFLICSNCKHVEYCAV